MTLSEDVCYRALAARDRRFDGLFFVCVTSTGIYCRSVCTAKTPRRENCRFAASAAAAERDGYRPCLRCRPELAPGHAPVDAVRTVARIAAARIEAGALNDGRSLEDLATTLRVSSRQLRRAVQQEFGVSPIALAQTNRLLLAKRLIAETRLPLVEVSFAAGFDSVRRFNALFQSHYRLTPSALRRSASPPMSGDSVRLQLAYRPPFEWQAMLRFLAAHVTPGVECVHEGVYHRTAELGAHRGWLSVSQVTNRDLLAVELSTSLMPALPKVLARLRNLFDLDARPDVIAAHLACDPLLAKSVARQPGLRVPGAFDPFELAVRAVVGQQVTVRGATTLASRLAAKFGEPIDTPRPCLNRLAPTASTLAAAGTDAIAAIGLPSARARSIWALACAVRDGDLDLEAGTEPLAAIADLQRLPGIGPWTAEYIALRALQWPDAFPAADLALLKLSGEPNAKSLERRAEAWRPWRAYSVMHLWHQLPSLSGEAPTPAAPRRLASRTRSNKLSDRRSPVR